MCFNVETLSFTYADREGNITNRLEFYPELGMAKVNIHVFGGCLAAD
jgi:hypothetical protein